VQQDRRPAVRKLTRRSAQLAEHPYLFARLQWVMWIQSLLSVSRKRSLASEAASARTWTGRVAAASWSAN